MKERKLFLLPYLVVLAADFYLLPLLMRDTGGAMVVMLCLMPLLALGTGVVCGVRRGFRPLLGVAALVLFLPAIPLYYNASAWVYSPVYALLVFAGMGVGRLFYGRR